MKILLLYHNPCATKLRDYLQACAHIVVECSDALDAEWFRSDSFDLVVSYTYRFIIKKPIIELMKGNIVNLHTSYLPWNRGASPNIWSAIEDTPRGVTLHYIDEHLDKGKIIAQRLVPFEPHATLKTSYEQLDREAISLFQDAFCFYDFWKMMAFAPTAKGSYHSVENTKRVTQNLKSWDISVEQFKHMNDRKVSGSGGKECGLRRM